jgi:hypothetical protein
MPTTAPKREATPSGQRGLLAAWRAFRRGDFTVRLPLDLSGVEGKIAAAFNAREVGSGGKLARQAQVVGVSGTWKDPRPRGARAIRLCDVERNRPPLCRSGVLLGLPFERRTLVAHLLVCSNLGAALRPG